MKNEQSAAKLLLSVSAIGMAAMSPANAQSGMWISIEGGAADFSIEGDGLDPMSPSTFAIEAGVQIGNSPYSISFGFRNSGGSYSEYYAYSGSDYVGYPAYANYDTYTYKYGELESNWRTMDFEIGKDISLGQSGTGRLALGVRYAETSMNVYAVEN